MAQSDFGTRVAQYPGNMAGTLGEHSMFALARVHIGTGGLPVPTRNFATGVATGLRTVYGFEGLGATLVGTGLYEISHPPANIAAVFPQYVGPSGTQADITPQWSRGNSASGVVRLQVTKPFAGGSGPNNAPSGFTTPFNVASGSRFDLLFFVNPRNDQSLTQY